MNKDVQEKIQQLQLLEQNMQQFHTQRQQFQAQLAEVDSALKELENAKEAYKIIGNIMVSSNKEELQKNLKEKKEIVELRIKTMEKQEGHLKNKAKKIQEEVLEEMEKDKKEEGKDK